MKKPITIGVIALIITVFLSSGVISIEAYAETSTIPEWIKNNAEWWAQGLITDDDFVKGIQFLVEHGIIQV